MSKTTMLKNTLTVSLLAFRVVFLLGIVVQISSAQQTNSPVKAPTVQAAPVNLDFEQGAAGQVPTGWHSPPQVPGYAAETIDRTPRTGTKTAVLGNVPDVKIGAGNFGNLMQAVDAVPFRGRRVLLRGWVRVEAVENGGRAQLWMRVDRADGKNGFFDNMSDRPITSGEWKFYEIVGEVEEDAQILNFGMILLGVGKAYLDDVSIEDLGKSIVRADPPRPLSDRGLKNTIAFTRLLGYVRHFHPSDEAAAVDWEVFALEGIGAVESAKNKKELAERLDKLFRPVAPTVRVFQTGKRAAASKDLMPARTDGLKIISWHHTGYGQKNVPQSAYRSERKTREISAEKTPENAHDPRQPFVANLGGGISAAIPLALFTDEKGTFPHAADPNQNKESENKPAFKFSGNDRLTRLTSVALAWNVFQHFYPYFDVVQTDWNKTLRDSLTKAAADKDEKEFMLTLRLMVAQLRDGHGNVIDTNAAVRHALPVLFRWIENRLVVTRAGENAEGLQPGDVIISFDGKPSAEAVTEMETITSGATAQWLSHIAMVKLQIGAKDSEARLEVETAAGQRRFVTLRRNAESLNLHERTSAEIEEIKPGIFYVDLDRIADEAFSAALPNLEKAKGIVFDVRGYPRVSPIVLQHLIDKPVQSAHWLIPIVRTPDHRNMSEFNRGGRWNLEPKQPHLAAKIAFLTDGRAISYAESYMGIIEAYKLAEIVGEPTAGTNGNVNPFTVPGGYRISWTGMKVLKHDDSQHHGVGIKPTVPVSRTIQGIREKRDEQLERALMIVSQ